MDKLSIKKSKIHGNGIFAEKTIKKGEAAFRFSNRIFKNKHRDGCHCKICKRCIQISELGWLYPGKKSYGWYLNHSCSPSCGIKGRDIVALKNISSNEEITIDYSTTHVDERWKMKCSCKNSNCRLAIKSIQSLPKQIYKKYEGFMPRYVERHFSKFN